MKKFVTLLGLAMVASTGITYAQFSTYAQDALRFSQTNFGSSARFKGLGNAQTSLGGDISSIGGNPAGLGMFTRSEFSFTPEFNSVSSNANYFGQGTKSSKDKLNLNQAGVVWYNPVIRPKGADLNQGVISFVWGIGYNRNNDFTGNYSFGGKNPNNSFGDFAAENATNFGQTHSQFTNGSLRKMAYDNFLINETGNTGTFTSATSSKNNLQSYNQVRYGSTSEFNFAGAMNISNQFYLGASIGFVNVRYGYDSQFTESGTITSTPQQLPTDPKVGDAYTLSYRQSQSVRGNGVNGRLGLIYKPINEVRIGVTYQTPTWMHMEDVTSEVLDTRYTSANTSYTNVQNNYVFQYNLRNPSKTSLGASVILGGSALLTADVDYVNYAGIKLSNAADYYAPEEINNNNMDVKDFYTHAFNYRVGAEYKIDPSFTIRAGYGINGTPYKDDKDNLSQTKYFSGGLGYKINQYYIDLAYQRVQTNQTFSPYTFNNQSLDPVATAKVDRNNVFLTFGVRF